MNDLVVVKAPLRISFVGGGTDYKNYYKHSGGCVFSAAIDKYVYILIKKYHNDKRCVFKYSKSEQVNKINDIKHPLIKNSLSITGVWGIALQSIADIPGGTGLGSSSSFTVALIKALNEYKRKKISKSKLAQKACDVEINLSKSPTGKQDQYAAAYGGVNTFLFKKNEKVEVKNFSNKKIIKNFKENLLLINTGIQKKNQLILQDQMKNISLGGKYLENLKLINDSVEIFKKNLIKKDYRLCGEILHENWKRKISLSKKTRNLFIDEVYSEAINQGAYGGKVCGAGGRGFLLLICPKNIQRNIKKKLYKLQFLDFEFDYEGCKVIKLI